MTGIRPREKRQEEVSGLIAAVQTSPAAGDVDANMREAEAVLGRLPDAADRLVVFPEMGSTGYFLDGGRLSALAEPVPEGPITRRWIELARKHRSYLVAGLPEREGSSLYNTVVLVGPEGFVAKYRKLHLWSEEKLRFAPGDLGLVVADLPICRVGLMICYDTWFPEQARILRLLGADVLAIPSALVWNDTPAHVKRGYYMADYVAMTTAHLNQVHVALASQVGRYGGSLLFGSSVLVDPFGWPLVEPAGDLDPAVLHARVDYLSGAETAILGTPRRLRPGPTDGRVRRAPRIPSAPLAERSRGAGRRRRSELRLEDCRGVRLPRGKRFVRHRPRAHLARP